MGPREVWRRWLVLATAGELAGFFVPVLVGVWLIDRTTLPELVLMPVAGLAEGALLGASQAAVLRGTLRSFRPGRWVIATAVGAAVAWFLGMLPSTTYAIWSDWPRAAALVVAAPLTAALLGSIGTLQALVLPRSAGAGWVWVGWTVLGWGVGLFAFMALATPLWHEGQALWLRTVIGLGAGTTMAVSMAAVTGVGAARLVERNRMRSEGAVPGWRTFTDLVGAPVLDTSDQRVGEVRDLVVDLGRDPQRPPVTHVLVHRRRTTLLVPWAACRLRQGTTGLVLVDQAPGQPELLPASALILGRDVLDTPVISQDPPARKRVNDVVIELGPEAAWVSGLDLGGRAAVRRLLPRRHSAPPAGTVPFARVHLLSPGGHAAQLAAPPPTTPSLSPLGVAEVVTRLPVAHARDLLDTLEEGVRADAVRHLHPHVRGHLGTDARRARRTRRLGGWRLHRPGSGGAT